MRLRAAWRLIFFAKDCFAAAPWRLIPRGKRSTMLRTVCRDRAWICIRSAHCVLCWRCSRSWVRRRRAGRCSKLRAALRPATDHLSSRQPLSRLQTTGGGLHLPDRHSGEGYRHGQRGCRAADHRRRPCLRPLRAGRLFRYRSVHEARRLCEFQHRLRPGKDGAGVFGQLRGGEETAAHRRSRQRCVQSPELDSQSLGEVVSRF